MGFSRQEYWSGLPFPSPGDLPDRGIKPGSPELQEDSLHLSHRGSLQAAEWGWKKNSYSTADSCPYYLISILISVFIALETDLCISWSALSTWPEKPSQIPAMLLLNGRPSHPPPHPFFSPDDFTSTSVKSNVYWAPTLSQAPIQVLGIQKWKHKALTVGFMFH